MADGSRSSAEISELLVEAFPDGSETIADDVMSTLDELATEGAIEFV